MSEKNILSERKNSLEEDDSNRKEQELVEKIRQRSAPGAERRELAEASGVADEEILALLQELGYTRETVELLHLAPLVQVAWANGSVTPREREMVLKLAEWRGIAPESPARNQLIAWLDNRPSDEFFANTLRIIRRILDTRTVTEQISSRSNLISFCIRIAAASGGFLGISGKVSEEEQAALDLIAEELTSKNPEAVRQVLE